MRAFAVVGGTLPLTETVGGEAMMYDDGRKTRHSNNSIDSDGLSENERGYSSDVSNSESPPPDVVIHHRRRSKLPDKNPVNGSVSDTDDDNTRLRQFERKPPRGKSSRRRSRQPTDDEPKIECYNGERKRFSWTDSGVSSSMGTGPHTRKLSHGNLKEDQTEKSRSTEDVSGMRDIVHDTFNAVNELKDLQRSFKRTHSEHKLCKFFPDSDKCSADPEGCCHESNSLVSSPHQEGNTPLKTMLGNLESENNSKITDSKAAISEPISYDDYSIEDIINSLQIKDIEAERQINKKEFENSDCLSKKSNSIQTPEAQGKCSSDCIDFKPSPLKISIDANDPTKREVTRKAPEILENYTAYTEIASQQPLTIPEPPNLVSDPRISKSKTFMSGLRKVASQLKPSSFRNNTAPTLLSKDVSSEFSYAKRKIDEDTIQQLQTITSKFREEITHIQNISINNLTADDEEVKAITTPESPVKTSSEDEEVVLDRLAVKQSAPSLMDKVFSRRRSYNALAVKEKKEKEKKRASFCDNVFISPCNGGTYSPVSDSYKPGGRRDTRGRSGSGVGSCSFSSTSSLTFNEADETNAQNISFSSCGGENEERQRQTRPPSPLPPPPLPPPPLPQQLQPQQQPHPQANISFQSSDIPFSDECVSSTNNTSFQSSHGGPSPFPCGYSPSLHVHSGTSGEVTPHQHDCPQCAYADYLNYVQFLQFREAGYMWPQLPPYGGNYYGGNVPYGGNGGFNYYSDHYQQCSESSSYPTEGNDCSRDNMEVISEELCEPISDQDTGNHDNNNGCYGDEDIVDSEYGTYV